MYSVTLVLGTMFKIYLLTLILILLSLSLKKTHPISLLISLEFFSLFLILLSCFLGFELFLGLLIICVGACEGAVGLGCLIAMTRSLNNVNY